MTESVRRYFSRYFNPNPHDPVIWLQTWAPKYRDGLNEYSFNLLPKP